MKWYSINSIVSLKKMNDKFPISVVETIFLIQAQSEQTACEEIIKLSSETAQACDYDVGRKIADLSGQAHFDGIRKVVMLDNWTGLSELPDGALITSSLLELQSEGDLEKLKLSEKVLLNYIG